MASVVLPAPQHPIMAIRLHDVISRLFCIRNSEILVIFTMPIIPTFKIVALLYLSMETGVSGDLPVLV